MLDEVIVFALHSWSSVLAGARGSSCRRCWTAPAWSVHPEFVGCCGTSAAWGHTAYKGKNRDCRPGAPTGHHRTATTCECTDGRFPASLHLEPKCAKSGKSLKHIPGRQQTPVQRHHEKSIQRSVTPDRVRP